MADPRLRQATASDLPAILALNQEHAAQTSSLDSTSLAALTAAAFRTLVVDAGHTAFLIALDAHADYASLNYHWVRARFTQFVYIDRVITAPSARGQGWARKLYAQLCNDAAATGLTRVLCEVNHIPPNPGSDAFHAALGFTECGRATHDTGAKTVRYLTRAITSPIA